MCTHTHTYKHTQTYTSGITMNNAGAIQSLFISMRSCGTYNTHRSHTSSSSSYPRCTTAQVADCSSWSSIPALLLSDISSTEVSSSSSRKARWLTRLFTSDGSHWDFYVTANVSGMLMGGCLGPAHLQHSAADVSGSIEGIFGVLDTEGLVTPAFTKLWQN